MNENELRYIFNMITGYWQIIKAAGNQKQSTKSDNKALHDSINHWWENFTEFAPDQRHKDFVNNLLDSLVCFYLDGGRISDRHIPK